MRIRRIYTHKGTRAGFYVIMIAGIILANFSGFQFVPTALAADAGFFAPNQTVASSSVTNPDNGWVSDDNRATFNSSGDYADYGFADLGIPTDSIINGIEVAVEGKRSNDRNLTVALWNTSDSYPASYTSTKTATLSGSDTTSTLGGSADTWGKTWIVSDFADATFKLRVKGGSGSSGSGDALLDQIQVKVFFTAPAVPAVNPILSNSCGLDISLVADVSGTIDHWEMAQLKSALTTFSNAFTGTPTVFSLTKFSTTATVISGYSLNPAQAATAIATLPYSGSNYTNWDDGLAKSFGITDFRPTKQNLIVIATDGNPNKYGNPALPSSGMSESAAMAAAITRANAIKGAGTRILAIGIGSDMNVANLKLITGTKIAPPATIDSTADVVTADFSTLGIAMAEIAKGLCGGTITVTKIIDQDGNLQTTGDQIPGAGWGFNVAGSDQTTDTQGQTSAVDVISDQGSFTVTESLQSGYSLIGASCIVSNDGNASTGTFNSQNHQITGITVGTDDIVSCTFYNAPLCGNSVINEGEQCDGQVGVGAHQQCSQSCQLVDLTYCGDGTQQTPNQELKDGPLNDGYEACDGQTGVGEHQACTSQCTLITLEFCGDTVKNGQEQCDGSDGVGKNQACSPECTLIDLPYCGDGVKNNDEQCDGQSGIGAHQSCSSDCALINLTYCGDGIKQSPNQEHKDGPLNDGYEACDGTSGVGAHQQCTAQCTLVNLTYCGDGIVQNPNDEQVVEECDPGPSTNLTQNQSNLTIAMSRQYDTPTDGDTDTGGGGTDTSNDNSNATCSNQCKLLVGHIIVDAVTDPANSLQSFDFTVTGTGYVNFSLTDQTAPNDQLLSVGTYSVSETVPTGWSQTGAVCDNQQTPSNINLVAGQTITCTFTNTYTPPSLPQCSDGSDNDEDSKTDSADPGCHMDGNPQNTESYNPLDNNETDEPVDVCPNLEGTQTSVPDGKVLNSDGNCVDHTSPPVTPPPSGGGGGGGVGGGGFQSLLIFNEKNETVSPTAATVSWFTNVSATCIALYDTVSHDNSGTPPTYGYSLQVPGITSNGTYHTATITGLMSGNTYYWRPTCTATSSSQTALGQQLTIALIENPAVLGYQAPTQPEENVQVLGFEILPKTGGDMAGYYTGIFSVFGTILIGLYLGYRRARRA